MENRKQRSSLLAIFVPLLIIIVLSASVVGYFFILGTSLKQVNRDGAVKIVAKYIKPDKTQEKGTSFSLLIETHSDEFDSYDVRKLSFLRVNGGPLQPAVKWTPSGKGHHLDGKIEFAQAIPDGTHNLQLIVKNIDGLNERILEWQITVKPIPLNH